MRTEPCDELGANLAEAGEHWNCRLDPSVAEALIEYMCAAYATRGPDEDFEALLEHALDLEGIAWATERHAYKKALGLFFNARRKAREEARALQLRHFLESGRP